VTFTPGQVAALKKLRELWPDTPFVLVGASALGCFLDFRWRATNDIDISVSIELDELPAGLDRLPGWSPDTRAEHRWLAPENVKVDILPAGPNLRRAGTLRWPRSGNEMSLLGQRLAFEQARDMQVARDLSILVAPVPVVCLLKMVAYGWTSSSAPACRTSSPPATSSGPNKTHRWRLQSAATTEASRPTTCSRLTNRLAW